MIRHPRRRALTAWFDGEGADEVGSHLSRCARCARIADDFALVRGTIRGETPRTRLPQFVLYGGVPAMALAVALVVGLFLGSAVPDRQWGAPLRLATKALGGDTATSPPRALQEPTERRATDGPAPRTAGVETPQPPRGLETEGEGAPAVAAPLRLAVEVPTEASAADEGREILRAARAAVEAANRSGGVGGQPVLLEELEPDDGRRSGATRVDAYVGGSGAAGSGDEPPWLLPGDPAAAGPRVLRAEVAPFEAGRRLAASVVARGFQGHVGVVTGPGGDAELAAGVAEVARQQRASLDGRGGCDRALLDLRRKGAVALALAGDPTMVATCADAALSMGWAPPGGLLVPPSVAYSPLQHRLSLRGARTVLGLPWPTSRSSGARRFQAVVPGPTISSYRAVLTFAAVEVAVMAAREGVAGHDVARGSWRTDLAHFEQGANVGASVVVATDDGWERSP